MVGFLELPFIFILDILDIKIIFAARKILIIEERSQEAELSVKFQVLSFKYEFFSLGTANAYLNT